MRLEHIRNCLEIKGRRAHGRGDLKYFQDSFSRNVVRFVHEDESPFAKKNTRRA